MIILAEIQPGVVFLLLWGLLSWFSSKKKKKSIELNEDSIIDNNDLLGKLNILKDNIFNKEDSFVEPSAFEVYNEENNNEVVDFNNKSFKKNQNDIYEEKNIKRNYSKDNDSKYIDILKTNLNLKNAIIMKEILDKPRSINPL